MTAYIPTAIQREALGADHSIDEVKRSIVRLVSTGKGIDRVKVDHYVAHEVDTTGENDTVGVYYLEIRADGKVVRGYGTFAFNVIYGVPFAADFREFHPVMKSV